MNETMSLLLATAILAAGGIGLFMFKSPDDKEDYDDTEDIILDELDDLDDLDDYEEDYKPRHKSANRNKTKRNRKSGGSRRRY
jgi:hypothetical protein